MIISGSISGLLERNKESVVLLFFSLFFLTGLLIYKDYGMSWDEYAQWHDNGYANFNFIFHNDKATLLNGIDKYHGPAFELLLIAAEKLFRLTDSRDIFLMRHLAIFITFFISSVFFFFTAKKIFNDRRLALIGAFFFILTPHIFAHSFYNSKDAVFLVFFTISMYALICFHEKPGYIRAIVFAAVTAFTIDIRIIGILIPLISLFLILAELISSIRKKKEGRFYFVKPTLLYFMVLMPCIVLFWPVLWLGPVHHFIEALKENSVYPWNGAVLYFGKTYKAAELPWHYIPFWIFISRPIFYSVLFFVGTVSVCYRLIKKPDDAFITRSNMLICFFWFFLPLAILFILKSTTFDTGRHLYFMNGGFVLLMLFGFRATQNLLRSTRVLRCIFYVLVLLLTGNLIYRMIRIHPYQNLYFNAIAGNDMEHLKDNFEFDYWGVSSKEVLEKLLAQDTSAKIKLFAENFPGKVSSRILTKAQRKRLEYTDTPEEAEYFIADYRWHKEEEYTYRNEASSAVLGNTEITTAFRIRLPDKLYKQVRGAVLKSFSTDYEGPSAGWTFNKVVKPGFGAHSGLFSDEVDSIVEFGSGLYITNLSYIYNRKSIVLKASFWRFISQQNASAKFVATLVGADGTAYFWSAVNETEAANRTGEWEKVCGAVDLPQIRSTQDILKVYLWNTGRKRIFTDDVKIELIEEDTQIKNK